jgi:hypothetical protein
VGGSYNSQTKKVVLTLQNGNTIEFSVADLVSGLQTELSASNKLNPAYINYDSAHRAVSDTEKSNWNGKQSALTTAQLAAVNSGITAEKLETIDTALSDKVDKIPGKGLSTNDFTDADKTKLNGIEQGATKTVIDAALGSTSTNPVQNKAVRAPIARLIDAGAKNVAAIDAAPSRSDLDIQVADGHVSISGTLTGTFTWRVVEFDDFVCKTDMVVIGAKTRTGVSYQCRYTDSASTVHYDQIPDGGILTIPAGSRIQYLYFQQNTGGVYIAIEVDVMLCTAEDYAISPEFVPYAPSNRELYEMILALQNGG